MKKVKMQPFFDMTFEEGCEKHFLYCRQRNLSETTLIRYRAYYSLYYKFFDPDMPLNKIDATMFNAYILYLHERLENAITHYLFCTGVRSHSLLNIQVKDIDFENSIAVIRAECSA